MSRSTETAPIEHNEYHSSLEFDDTTGWHVYVVPAAMLLTLVGAILALVLSQ
jgi:hypothetical protein